MKNLNFNLKYLKSLSPIILFVGVLFLFSCKKKNKTDLHFTFLPSSETNITFNNKITETDSINFYNNEYMYIGSGVGVGDFNNDGLQDVFFGASQSGCKLYLNGGNFQFEDITNKAGIKNTNWVTGINVVDINQDGWQDVYLCVSHFKDPEKRKNLLYINQGGTIPIFKEQADKYGLADTGFSSQAAFFDYDKDGDLDMYLLNHKLFEPQPNRLVPIDSSGKSLSADKLYRNNGLNKPFTDISIEAGILEDGYGLGLMISDLNGDNYPDIYVGNDYLSNDFLWLNDQHGHFKNIIGAATKHQSFSSMGVDAADINNDLLPDLAVLDMMPNTNERKKMMVLGFSPEKFEMQRQLGYQQQFSRNMLQLNRGVRNNISSKNPPIGGEGSYPIFSEIGHLSNTAETDWSWSVLLADFDNDSWRDMHISNGLARDLTNNDFIAFTQENQQNEYSFGGGKQTINSNQIKDWRKRLEEFGAVKRANFMFVNNKNLQFDDISESSGITQSSVSQGAAYADFDNDGDLDIIVNNMNQEAFVIRNELRQSANDSTHNFLRIVLKGNNQNRLGYGAKVLIYNGLITQMGEQSPVRGYASSVDQRLHFGFGNEKKIDSLKIAWASGMSQTIKNISTNQELILMESSASLQKDGEEFNNVDGTIFEGGLSPTTFMEKQEVVFKHQETPFFDYYSRRLQPQKYSQLGPCMAIADINGDGREDVFIGGAVGQSGKLFIQSMKTSFLAKPSFNSKDLQKENKQEEDLAAVFIDVDSDKDMDLIITGGSTEYSRGFPSSVRLFLNDGIGNFSKKEEAFPANLDIFSTTVAPNDFDDDGDMDLFIGGRIDKQKFPETPKSYFFENNHGIFKDITASFAPDLQYAGMITSAIWMDLNHDKKDELVIAGEWAAIRFFKNTGKKLVEITDKTKLINNNGMWRSLAIADLDDDGDMDIVAGNYGENNKYHASGDRPFYLFAKDLDNSGTNEILPAYYIKNNKGDYDLFPDFDRHQIADQTPIIKKKYLYHHDFAQATIGQLIADFGEENMIKLKCQTTKSVWLENLGNGQFKSHDLPIEAQFAPINTILVSDFDFDGKQDILLAGNEYQTEVSTGRSDASIGLFLKGNNKGLFKSVGFNQSGFLVEGDVKSMVKVGKSIFVGINNEMMKTFKTN